MLEQHDQATNKYDDIVKKDETNIKKNFISSSTTSEYMHNSNTETKVKNTIATKPRSNI